MFAGNPLRIKQCQPAGRRGNVQSRVQQIARRVRRVHVQCDGRGVRESFPGKEKDCRRQRKKPPALYFHPIRLAKSWVKEMKFSTGNWDDGVELLLGDSGRTI
jgi:hypothetical protein